MDADEGSKHNQKFIRKDSQVLYEIISSMEIIMEDGGGHSINEKWGGLKSITLVMEWNIWPSHKSETGLNKVAMLSFYGAILGTSVRTG